MTELTIIRQPVSEPLHPGRRVKLLADRATLTKRRWRGVAEDGKEFGFDLTHPLAPGSRIHVAADTHYIIEQVPEEVLEIPITTVEEAGRVAWSLGNLHFGVQVTEGAIRVAHDSAVRQVLEREGGLIEKSAASSCRFRPGRITTTIIMNEREAFPWLARLLQVSDSAFPTGAYAHSYGFEQVVRFGGVHDADSLAAYLDEHLWPALIHFELPVVRCAREAALDGDLPALIDLDACIEATRTARESREASRATGRRRLHAFCEGEAPPLVTRYAQGVEDGCAHAHHAVVFGLGLAAMPQCALLSSWAFQSLSAICLSAPKLLRIGQDAAQRVLTAGLRELQGNVDRSLSISRDELGWFDPFTDLASMQHEIADERLFIS